MSSLDELLLSLREKTYDRPLLYVAAPYTNPDPVENTNKVIKVATIIYEQTKWVPMIPHLSLLWHMVVPRPGAFWYELDLHQMAHCAAIVRLPGESPGADNEIIIAEEMGIEIVPFWSLPYDAIIEWGSQCPV